MKKETSYKKDNNRLKLQNLKTSRGLQYLRLIIPVWIILVSMLDYFEYVQRNLENKLLILD